MFDPLSAVTAAKGYAISIGSKVLQLAGKKSNKPKLVLNPVMKINPILINCFIEDIDLGVNHPEGKGFKLPYLLNRVIVKNLSRVPAEYCEGFIVKEGNLESIPWSKISEGVRILIPAQSTKELDVCAMLYLNPIEFNRINKTLFDTDKLVSIVNRLQIPDVISPNESGIQSPPSLNRHMKSGGYQIQVDYKSTESLTIPIVISSQMDDLGIFLTVGT